MPSSSKLLFQSPLLEDAILAFLKNAVEMQALLKSGHMLARLGDDLVAQFMSTLDALWKSMAESEKTIVGLVRASPRDAHSFMTSAENCAGKIDTDSMAWNLYQIYGFICRDNSKEMPIGSFGNPDTQLKLFEKYFPAKVEIDSEDDQESDTDESDTDESDTDRLLYNLHHRLFNFGYETHYGGGFEMDGGFVDGVTLAWLS